MLFLLYSGLYLNQAPIDTNNGNEMSMPSNDINPSSFAINDSPIDDMGHLSRSLLWETNYSTSTGNTFGVQNISQEKAIFFRCAECMTLILHILYFR